MHTSLTQPATHQSLQLNNTPPPPNKLRPHPLTISSFAEAVNSKCWVFLCHLLRLDVGQCLYGVQSRVLRQRHWYGLQGIRKCPHSILLQCGHLIETSVWCVWMWVWSISLMSTRMYIILREHTLSPTTSSMSFTTHSARTNEC